MLKAVIRGERRAAVVEVPTPKPVGDRALVKVHVAPMCTEYKAFVAGRVSDYLGHEAAGEVVAVAQPGRVQVGDRVVVMPQYPCGRCEHCVSGGFIYCEETVDVAAYTGSPEGRATMAQYLLKPDWLLVPIPEGMSYEHASMACCGLGPTFGAMERIDVDAFDTLLITGLGPVGLGGVINARYRGARVIGVDANRYRAELATRLGAEAVIDPEASDALGRIRELTGGRGVDKAIDCSGVVAGHRLCLEAVRRRGAVAFVGESTAQTPLCVSPDLLRKGLTVVGSWHHNLKDTPRLLRVIAESGPQIDALITHTFPLSEVQRAWELQASGQCAKVLLRPWADRASAPSGTS